MPRRPISVSTYATYWRQVQNMQHIPPWIRHIFIEEVGLKGISQGRITDMKKNVGQGCSMG